MTHIGDQEICAVFGRVKEGLREGIDAAGLNQKNIPPMKGVLNVDKLTIKLSRLNHFLKPFSLRTVNRGSKPEIKSQGSFVS